MCNRTRTQCECNSMTLKRITNEFLLLLSSLKHGKMKNSLSGHFFFSSRLSYLILDLLHRRCAFLWQMSNAQWCGRWPSCWHSLYMCVCDTVDIVSISFSISNAQRIGEGNFFFLVAFVGFSIETERKIWKMKRITNVQLKTIALMKWIFSWPVKVKTVDSVCGSLKKN